MGGCWLFEALTLLKCFDSYNILMECYSFFDAMLFFVSLNVYIYIYC